MPKFSGLFNYFPDISDLPAERIVAWFRRDRDPILLENNIGNRILYPQAIPVSKWDLDFDLVILREMLKVYPNQFYNSTLKRFFIPDIFLERFPDIKQLTWAYIDAFEPIGITQVYVRSSSLGVKGIGSVIKPVVKKGSKEACIIWVDNKKYQVKEGSLLVIPASNNQVAIKYESNVNKLIEKNQLLITVIGGLLGVIIDARVSK